MRNHIEKIFDYIFLRDHANILLIWTKLYDANTRAFFHRFGSRREARFVIGGGRQTRLASADDSKQSIWTWQILSKTFLFLNWFLGNMVMLAYRVILVFVVDFMKIERFALLH